jgi:serine/threonine protein phosphatase PrpC
MSGFFQRIFGTQKNQTDELTAEPIPEEPIFSPEESYQELLNPPQLVVGAAQSVGMQREHNEDSLFTLTSIVASNQSQINFGLYIVADGMGGHRYGEVASELAVQILAEQVTKKLLMPLFQPEQEMPHDSIQEILRDGVYAAHREITKETPGGGTTLTAALVLGERLTIAHVGDSRAYLFANEEVRTLTRDHSLVKRLVELGQITAEEAAIHPQRNVLYRALGQGEPLEADISTSSLPESGYLMLCSDGLWGVVPLEDLVEIVRESATIQQACQRMVNAANEKGGPDNITVILVRLPG